MQPVGLQFNSYGPYMYAEHKTTAGAMFVKTSMAIVRGVR